MSIQNEYGNMGTQETNRLTSDVLSLGDIYIHKFLFFCGRATISKPGPSSE